MAIRKPALSVKEARLLAEHRADDVLPVAPDDPRQSAFFSETRSCEIGLEHDRVVSAPPDTVKPSAAYDRRPSVASQPAAITGSEPKSPTGRNRLPVLAATRGSAAIAAEATPPNLHMPSGPSSWRGERGGKAAGIAAHVASNRGPARRKPQVTGVQSGERKIQVFLSAALPASTVSKSFDLLCKQYVPAKALQMILRRAMDDYEVLLEHGDLHDLPGDYPEAIAPDVCGIIQTSRMMPITLVERARIHFDPLGFESDRAFGRKLASAALSIFFEIQSQHR